MTDWTSHTPTALNRTISDRISSHGIPEAFPSPGIQPCTLPSVYVSHSYWIQPINATGQEIMLPIQPVLRPPMYPIHALPRPILPQLVIPDSKSLPPPVERTTSHPRREDTTRTQPYPRTPYPPALRNPPWNYQSPDVERHLQRQSGIGRMVLFGSSGVRSTPPPVTQHELPTITDPHTWAPVSGFVPERTLPNGAGSSSTTKPSFPEPRPMSDPSSSSFLNRSRPAQATGKPALKSVRFVGMYPRGQKRGREDDANDADEEQGEGKKPRVV